MKDYGKELILDIHNSNPEKFNRRSLRKYLKGVCELIKMERCKIVWWDDLHTPESEKETEPHLVGTTAVQFIKTSNITIHSLDILRRVYINIFSCKDFDSSAAVRFSVEFFGGKVARKSIARRV